MAMIRSLCNSILNSSPAPLTTLSSYLALQPLARNTKDLELSAPTPRSPILFH